MVFNAKNKVCQWVKYQNKQVQVTLQFPEQSNPKLEQEFIDQLKEIYLRKIENGVMQIENLALSSPTTKEKEGNNNE